MYEKTYNFYSDLVWRMQLVIISRIYFLYQKSGICSGAVDLLGGITELFRPGFSKTLVLV